MASLIEQIETVRTAFESSDKEFEAREAAWAEVARITPSVNLDDEDASLALLRFVKQDLVRAGHWPTSAQPTLVALLPIVKRWQDLLNADFDVERAEAMRLEAAKVARWNSTEGSHERKLRAAEADVRYARKRLEDAQKELAEKEKNVQVLQDAQDVQH